MNNWKVEAVDYGDHQVWLVHERSKIVPFFASIGHWINKASFNTHAEAITYADRMARTVQLEIPRTAHHAGRFTLETENHPHGHIVAIRSTKSKQQLVVVHEEILPLATALLAHHYKQEQE